jgi:hypothetical protein
MTKKPKTQKTPEMRIYRAGAWSFAALRVKPTRQWTIMYHGQCCGTLDQQKDKWWDVMVEDWPVRSFRTFREACAAVAGEEAGDALSKKYLQA